MSELITARHTVTGIIDDYPDNILNHPVLGQYLVPVDKDDADPVASEPEAIIADVPAVAADEEEDDKVVIDKKLFRRSSGSTSKEPTGVKNDDGDV